MKIKITEEQLRVIIESKLNDNLINFTTISKSVSVDNWDDKFLELNQENNNKYDGYYINGNIKLNRSDIKKLDYLVKVYGGLDLKFSEIESLNKLEYVGGELHLRKSKITSLGNLKEVRGTLDLRLTPIEDLGSLSMVYGNLELDGSQVESLGDLVKVEGSLSLVKCPIEDLGKLEYVGTALDLRGTHVKNLGNLKYVYLLDVRNTPLSYLTTEDEIREKLNDDIEIYI